MDRKRLALATVALAALWAVTTARAQTTSQYSRDQETRYYRHQQRSKTLADRLGDFGRTLFGGGRAGPSERSTHRSGATSAGRDRAIELSPPVSSPRVAQTPAAPSDAGATASGDAEDTEPSASAFAPLHERLRAFRTSAFGSSATQTPKTSKSQPAKTPKAADTPSPDASRGGLENPASVYPKSPEAAALQRAVAERYATQRAVRPTAPEGKSSGPEAASSPGRGARPSAIDKKSPTIAPRSPTIGLRSPAMVPRSPAIGSRSPTVAPKLPAVGAKPPESLATEKATDPVEPDDAGVLFLRQSPILSVETHGPRRITVGKESAYEVIIHNSGQVAANELAVTVELPEWADVVGAEPSTGATETLGTDQRPGELLWKVGRLDAKSHEKLALRIVPRQSRPFELGVKWSFTPVRSQAEIEVQEPKLVLELDGPREVLHGRKQVYKLKLSNAGNGPADNLVVRLTPTGPGENVPASHKLGALAAGQKKVIEIELTARHAGQLTIQVSVDGDAGVHVELKERILVRRAALGLTVRGPALQYVGTGATYEIRLANTGNAPAKNVVVAARIPQGARQVSATQGGTISEDGKTVNWDLSELAPEAERTLLLKCELGQAGAGRLAVDASADDNLVASGAAVTQVEAIADLVLSVVDPAGPIPVGRSTTYQVRIQNRGSKSAENVDAVGYFSQGIEPTSAEGAIHKISPGQVVFGPIPTIAAGQTQLLTIRAKASAPGNHVFRAEVYCKTLGARLVSEETTRFYGTGAAAPETSVAQPSPAKAAPAESAPKTAERPGSDEEIKR